MSQVLPTAYQPNLNGIYSKILLTKWPTLNMAHSVMMKRLRIHSKDPIVHYRTRSDIRFPSTILYKTDLAVWDALIISAQQGLLSKITKARGHTTD